MGANASLKRLTRAQAEGVLYKLPDTEQGKVFAERAGTLRDEPGVLVEVLHLAQECFGYLPKEAEDGELAARMRAILRRFSPHRQSNILHKQSDIADSREGAYIPDCPLKLEICFYSCFWRKQDRCTFFRRQDRQITELKKTRSNASANNTK